MSQHACQLAPHNASLTSPFLISKPKYSNTHLSLGISSAGAKAIPQTILGPGATDASVKPNVWYPVLSLSFHLILTFPSKLRITNSTKLLRLVWLEIIIGPSHPTARSFGTMLGHRQQTRRCWVGLAERFSRPRFGLEWKFAFARRCWCACLKRAARQLGNDCARKQGRRGRGKRVLSMLFEFKAP